MKVMKANQEKTPQRQSNIELLRIIAMVMIILHHYAIHSNFAFDYQTLSLGRLWIQAIQSGGNLGVNVFILISGYFQIHTQKVRTARLLKLWLQIFFYSFGIMAIFMLEGRQPFGIREVITHAFPVTYEQWWFASTYFVLCLLAPFLNRLLHSLERKQYRGLLALLLLFWSVIPTFTLPSFNWYLFQENHLMWFVVLYVLGGYLRLYGLRTKKTGRQLIGLSAACIVLIFLSAVVLDALGTRHAVFADYSLYFYNMQRLPMLLTSVLLFVGFARLEIKPSRMINTLSSAMFGVYLLHDHGYVRPWLWLDTLRCNTYGDSPWLILHSLAVTAGIFVIGTAVELARIHLVEKWYLPGINQLAGWIDQKKENLLRQE